MRILYTFIFYFSLPFILLRLAWRGLKAPLYWQRWGERFGFSPELVSQVPVIWIHAVSVGEVEACRPLVKALKQHYPQHQLLVTTMTPTGSERVFRLFSDSVSHCFLPYDLPFAINGFLKKCQPTIGIIMETEIWPNLLHCCQQKSIPIILANARMSVRSQKAYAKFASFTQQTLQKFIFIASQGQRDKKHFQSLGAESHRVHAIGNLKFETDVAPDLMQKAALMRENWDKSRPVWVAASTHEGEEMMILDAFRTIQSNVKNVLLIIVPRHPERFDRVTALVHKNGFRSIRRSENQPCRSDIEVMVVDTMGELTLFYGCCDVAFVGGSLVNHGGHNLLEPASLARPTLVGPHFFNFTEITENFLKAKASQQINNVIELANAVTDLLKDKKQREHMGQLSLELINRSQGASTRLVNLIKHHVTL